jgi:hypothetical protein
MSMDKKSIAQFSDILRDKLLDETKAKAAYYRILPDSIQNVDEEHGSEIQWTVLGLSAPCG